MYIDDCGRKWFKGNLHMHTKNSDGIMTVDQATELYASRAYDFIAVTDHWNFLPTKRVGNLLRLSGIEYDIGRDPRNGVYHVVGAGMYTDPGFIKKKPAVQEVIDGIRANGGIAILAHPAWSMNTLDHILPLRGVDATEIFNSVSDLPHNCRPYSGAIVDLLAARGVYLPLVASDDVHWYGESEACRSYIWVQAEENSPEALIAAIRKGRFYATQGPRFSVTKCGRRITVQTTPATAVVFFSDTLYVPHRADVGEGITSSVYDIQPNDTFVRVEIRDKEGNWGWSRIIPVALP